MAYQVWSVVYGETPSASKWNILGTNDSSFNDLTGLDGGAWTSYVPTWSGAITAIGNAVVAFNYIKIGRLVAVKAEVVFGNTTTWGAGNPLIFTLPVTSIAYQAAHSLGECYIEDAGTAGFFGKILYNSATTAKLLVINVAGTYAQETSTSNTVPMTWTTNDLFRGYLIYESAS